jgi:DNA (cytosine-5)-methyltransferase 1
MNNVAVHEARAALGGHVGATHAPTFIDLFAGCGGLSLGLMGAGWRGLFAVEKDKFAFETLRSNLVSSSSGYSYAWPNWLPTQPCDIRNFLRDYRSEICSLAGAVDLIVGGPPCQGFSFAGRRRAGDSRNVLFRYYAEVVRLVQPSFLLLENVPGIAAEFDKGRRRRSNPNRVGRPPKTFATRIAETLEEMGYRVFPGLVKSAYFGVPQLRERFIVFAVHERLLPHPASAVDPHGILHGLRERFLRDKGLSENLPITASQALSDLETRGRGLVDCPDTKGFSQLEYVGPETTYQRLMHGMMESESPNSMRLARHRPDTRARFRNILRTCRRGVNLSNEDRERLGVRKVCIAPLDPNRPSPTLTTLPDDLLHYSEPRILTVREYARLQSFPDWFQFRGNYTTGGSSRVLECPRYTQVGNAVPPHLAEALGEALMEVRSSLRVPAQGLPLAV